MKHLAAIVFIAFLNSLTPACANFLENEEVARFAQELQQRHGFDTDALLQQFNAIHVNNTVLRLIKPPASPLQRSWARYRPRFINERRINAGVQFWRENKATLVRASALYGVPEEIIVAIIGVETEYGQNTGGFGVFEALATLAFYYPPRADFFRSELEQFLLLARENNMDPLSIRGSYAGAIGIPQFMPGSQRRYAVDFDGDKRVDLRGSVDDAIGSVARFLEQHGWQAGQEIAVPARLLNEPEQQWIDAGILPSLSASELLDKGVLADVKPQATVTLVDLVSPGQKIEYWLGFNNFYVITRYNRSSFYAMSVFQLGEAIRKKMPQPRNP